MNGKPSLRESARSGVERARKEREARALAEAVTVPEALIHYAPYGRNAAGKFDCGSGAGGYTDHPGRVTCEECKKRSPGLWPEHAAKVDEARGQKPASVPVAEGNPS